MALPDAPLRLSLDVLAAAEAAARRAGISPQQWIERLVLREAGGPEPTSAPQEVGPEDEVRGGPEATEKPAHQTDD
ncbi:hypothetical protein EJV46_00305 [Roseococcus sp. SYP-B2431]|uniref:hypothetical protein n=1 Tax=Roseococcus sp. SYP-B2431 TaxID=2496640 RepID=UPI00103F1EE2|nr:hypothetical protein [Roseococcus sp. SYP-B2431]TCI00934.1 hypothetical protein EJV46_00305 [Roseococcus sp. SYP-B2431]